MKFAINKRSAAKFYCLTVLLLPILFLYSTGISTITIGDVFLLIGLISLIMTNKRIILKPLVIILIAFIVLQAFLAQMKLGSQVLLTSLRFAFYIFACGLIPSLKLDVSYITKTYKTICFAATGLIFVQTIAYRFFGIVIPGVLQFLNLTDKSLYDYTFALNYTNSRRCMSVFGEPSHFAIYILPCLLICLLESEQLNRKTVVQAVVLTLGILVSATFTGLLGLFAVFAFWLLAYVRNKKIKIGTFIVVLLLGVAGLYFYNNSFVGKYLADGAIYLRQSNGRFAGYTYLAEQKMSTLEILFGHGMDDIGRSISVYLAGWARSYYYYGIVGTILYVAAIFALKKRNYMSLAIMLLMFVLAVGTDITFSSFIVIYILLINNATSYKEVTYE